MDTSSSKLRSNPPFHQSIQTPGFSKPALNSIDLKEKIEHAANRRYGIDPDSEGIESTGKVLPSKRQRSDGLLPIHRRHQKGKGTKTMCTHPMEHDIHNL